MTYHHSCCYSWMRDMGFGCPYTAFTNFRDLLLQNNAVFAVLLALASVTCLIFACKVLRIAAAVIRPYFKFNFSDSLRAHARPGSWAIVTGASDGIGKEFAIQLASRYKLNVVLISRTKSKLDAVAEVIEKANHNIEARVFTLDGSNPNASEWDSLAELVKAIDIGVLINCAGLSHSIPVPFQLETPEVLQNIIELNDAALVRITRLVLPQMLLKKRGCIANVGSASGVIPTPYLSVYGASKAFVRSFSIDLAHEVRSSNVAVHNLNTFFVSTAMSKIRKTSLTVPSPASYVKYALKNIGSVSPCAVDVTPYPAHALLNQVMQLLPVGLIAKYSASMSLQVRKKSLKRLESDKKTDRPARDATASSSVPSTPKRRSGRRKTNAD